MITSEIYGHVLPAVRLILSDLNNTPDAPSLEERVHARLWSYVTHAVREADPSVILHEAPKRDGRSKAWQYVVRFWAATPIGQELVAESDIEIMQGTGSLPGIVAQYAKDMHDGHLPAELGEDAIKEKLPQLRNNLGRQGSAVLRVEYAVNELDYLCQVDVSRPGA